MLRRLHRQRRRLGWMALCMTLALAYRTGIGPALLVAPLIGLAIAAAVVVARPRARTWVDCAGLALAVTALLPVPTVALPFLVPVMAYLADLVLYGRWWDRTPVRLGLVSRQTAILHGTLNTIWGRLVPGASHPDDHWSGTLIDFDADPDDALTLYLRHADPDGPPEEMTLTFLERTPPTHCRYLLERQTEGLPDEAEIHLALSPVGRGCTEVSSTLRQAALSPRTALARWLDDAMGDEWDSLTALFERRRDWSITGLGRDAGALSEPETISWPDDWPSLPLVRRGASGPES